MNGALPVLALFLLLALGLGLYARRGKDMDLEQWSVGGRGFGAILVFLLLAGEIYTTFTFLGAQRLLLLLRRGRVLHLVLRSARVRDVVLARPGHLALRQGEETDLAAGLVRRQDHGSGDRCARAWRMRGCHVTDLHRSGFRPGNNMMATR